MYFLKYQSNIILFNIITFCTYQKDIIIFGYGIEK